MHMKKFFLYTLFITALAVFGAVATQADRMNAKFSNADDADAFVAGAEANGQGEGAQVTHNDDGTTTVTLPEVSTEMMSETAMDAIAEHASGIDISDNGCPCWTEAQLDSLLFREERQLCEDSAEFTRFWSSSRLRSLDASMAHRANSPLYRKRMTETFAVSGTST